jgi:hypothetical protein
MVTVVFTGWEGYVRKLINMRKEDRKSVNIVLPLGGGGVPSVSDKF